MPTETAKPSKEQPDINQPGLSRLREIVANTITKQLPGRSTFLRDVLAGLSIAVSVIPAGLANGVLAGVNPIYGLYASIAGPLVGGLFTSTQLMAITSTSASSLAAGQALASVPAAAREQALFLMVILMGIFQVLLGLLRLGRVTRFVSYSVMTGFVTGIALLLLLSQLPIVTGYSAEGNNKVSQTFDLLFHLQAINLPSLALAVFTVVLAIVLPRTRLKGFGTLAAIAIPSMLVALFQLESIPVVRDVSEIPNGIPKLYFPSLADFSLDLLTGAMALSVITLVQGAGVSQSVPNRDGSPRNTSRDFVAQGAANLASGFLRGLPVGGSLSDTALSIIAGARTRWAMMFTGAWVALIVILLPGLIAYVAMPALGAMLIVASTQSIRLKEMLAIWEIGWPSRLASVVTFLSTLFLPITAAVGIGVALSALLYVIRSSSDISIVQLVERTDGRIEERMQPKRLTSNQVTVLDVYGNLFFAGARRLQDLLPSADGVQNPVVILRLRGQKTIGATLIEVLENYAQRLQEVDGRLYLTGLRDDAYNQIQQSEKLHLRETIQAYRGTHILLESTRNAYDHANTWLVEHAPGAAAEQAAQDSIENSK